MPRISLRLAIIILLLASWLTVPRVKHAQTQAQSPLPVYLIVAPESFADELAGFMVSQQTRGFDVQAVWLVQPYPDSDMIKAAIQSQIPLPKYVLLVGDSDLIPTWTVELASHQVAQTDLFYTTFDGPEDFVPDTILGRLPVHTESELTAYLAKLAAFYTIEWYPPWMKKISFVATNDLAFGDDVEAGFERVIKTYTQPNAYTGTFIGHEGSTVPTVGGDRLFPESYQADTQDVLDALDDKRVALVYNGRATSTTFEWRAGPWLSVNDVNNLTNLPVPLVAAFAPNTADFSVGASMADAWILNPESGALTYIGATADTVVPQDMLLMEGFFKGLFSNYAVPLSIGEAFQAGFELVNSGHKKDYFIIYQLFGDPSLTIRFPEGALLTAPFSRFDAPWGGTFTLPVTIKNVGPTEATFSILITSNQGYPLNIDPDGFTLPLSPGASMVIPVVIQIVTDLPVMTPDTINITASYTKTPDEIITTKLAITFQVFKTSLFLPIINR